MISTLIRKLWVLPVCFFVIFISFSLLSGLKQHTSRQTKEAIRYQTKVPLDKESQNILRKKNLIGASSKLMRHLGETEVSFREDAFFIEAEGGNYEVARKKVNGRLSILIEEASGILNEELEKLKESQRADNEGKREDYVVRMEAAKEKIVRLDNKINEVELKNEYLESQRAILDKKIDDLHLERNELLKVYTDSHPAVADLDSRIKDIEEKRINLLAPASSFELKDERSRYIVEYQKVKARLEMLEEEAKLMEVKSTRSLAASHSEAIPLGTASPSDRKVFALQEHILVFSLVVSLAIFLIFSYRALPMKTRELEKDFPYQERFLIIPQAKTKKNSIFTLPLAVTDSHQLKKTFNHIHAFAQERKVFSLFITSLMPREGKSFIALNLASYLSSEGKKVALVSFSLPRSLFAVSLAAENISCDDIVVDPEIIKKKEVGISDLIVENPLLADVLKRAEFDRIKFLFLKNDISQRSYLVLKDTLKNEVDYLIVDSLSLSQKIPIVELAQKNDFVALVYRRAPGRLLKRWAKELDHGKQATIITIYNQCT